jgi:mycothiol synthase
VTTVLPSLEIRTAVPDDLAAVQDLLALSLDCDDDARSLPAVLTAGPFSNPELQLVAAAGDEVVGTCLATIQPATNDAVGHLDLFAVAPSRFRVGVGRAMLAALEDRLRTRGAGVLRVGGNAPCYAWPGVDVRYTGMVELLRAAGYRRRPGEQAEAVNMTVRLTGAPTWLDTRPDEARLLESGIVVERIEPDGPAFASFMSGWGPRLTWEVQQAAERRPSACHAARRLDDGVYVAFACHHSNRAGWFGPMGTDPSARRLGIGSVLLRRCLADLAAEGRACAEISWVGPVGFYARGVDARISRVFWLFEKDL